MFFFQHRDRDSGLPFIYYIFRDRLGRVCLLLCPFVSVCSGLFFSSFLCFLHDSDRDSGSSFIEYMYLLFAVGKIRFSAEWSTWRAWRQTTPRRPSRLPRLCRQEQGVVSIIQEQAARLPVSLQQCRIRSVSRRGPTIIVYAGQHRHGDAQICRCAQMATGEPISLECSTSYHIWLRQEHRQDVRGEAARRWTGAWAAACDREVQRSHLRG